MSNYEFIQLGLKGAYLIKSHTFEDNRGIFRKGFEKDFFRVNHIEFNLQESFISTSKKNVIRGLHFQIHNPQAKLVSVIQGKVWDVIVDLRTNSQTFGQWYAAELSGENGQAFYIPRGFAHGFLSLEDNTTMLYQCDGAYDHETDTGIRFDDKSIGIEWPVDRSQVIVSDKDLKLMTFEEYLNKPMEL